VWHGGHAFPVPASGRLGVECEIAVRMARDLPRLDLAYEPADMPGAVAACMAAIEVVQDRYDDYPALGTPTLIADDFFHYACVLGPQRESFHPGSLRDVSGSMTINGTDVGHGTGTDIMGDPLDVLCWLANSCAAWGRPCWPGTSSSSVPWSRPSGWPRGTSSPSPTSRSARSARSSPPDVEEVPRRGG